MRRSLVMTVLALALCVPTARAAEIGIGAFGGVSIPILNDLSEQGTQFGVRVPVNLLPLLTVEPYFSSSALGEVDEDFGGPIEFTRDGGDLTAFGANALFTFGSPMVKFFPFVGIGSFKLERDGAEEVSDMGVTFGLGLGISPVPKLSFSVRGEMAAIITDETSQKFANVNAGASYAIFSLP